MRIWKRIRRERESKQSSQAKGETLHMVLPVKILYFHCSSMYKINSLLLLFLYNVFLLSSSLSFMPKKW